MYINIWNIRNIFQIFIYINEYLENVCTKEIFASKNL